MGSVAVAGQSGGPTFRHPSVRDRKIVLVGTGAEAQAWARKNHIDVGELHVTGASRSMVGLDPKKSHLVLAASFSDWRNPYFFMLKTEVSYMQAKGATVEWA